MIKITCTSCGKPLSLDETKLPMKEVSFPCPVCKTKLTVDRRKFEQEPAPPAEAHVEEDTENEFGSKAFIIGVDSPAIRQAAKLIGFLPVHFATAEQARDRFMMDAPHVVFFVPQPITPPPLDSMQAVISIVPADRRKSFFVLVADNLRTLDGNAAFLYGVNLVVATKDLASFPQIYRDAYTYHERLYANMNSVLKVLETV